MKIVVLINRSSGELEWIAPTIVSLLESEYDVDIVFLRNREFVYLEKSEELLNLLVSLGANLSVFESSSDSVLIAWLYRICNKTINYLPCSFKKVLNPKKIQVNLFFNQNNIDTSPDLLMFDNSFYKDLERSFGQSLHHLLFKYFRPREVLIFPHAPIINIQKKIDDKLGVVSSFVVSNSADSSYWKKYPDIASHTWQVTDSLENAQTYSVNRGFSTFHVKSPRYQLDWIRRNLNDGLNSAHNDTPQVLILSKLQGALFQKNSSLNSLDLIIHIIEKLEQNNVIWKIKPHPRDNLQILSDSIDKVSQYSFKETLFEGSLEMQATEFTYCISVPTSAVLDAVLLGIPTIEYFPAKDNNVVLDYDSPYQNENVVLGCDDLIEMDALIKKFNNKEYLKEVISNQQSHLSRCFCMGDDLTGVISQILNVKN